MTHKATLLSIIISCKETCQKRSKQNVLKLKARRRKKKEPAREKNALGKETTINLYKSVSALLFVLFGKGHNYF